MTKRWFRSMKQLVLRARVRYRCYRLGMRDEDTGASETEPAIILDLCRVSQLIKKAKVKVAPSAAHFSKRGTCTGFFWSVSTHCPSSNDRIANWQLIRIMSRTIFEVMQIGNHIISNEKGHNEDVLTDSYDVWAPKGRVMREGGGAGREFQSKKRWETMEKHRGDHSGTDPSDIPLQWIPSLITGSGLPSPSSFFLSNPPAIGDLAHMTPVYCTVA